MSNAPKVAVAESKKHHTITPVAGAFQGIRRSANQVGLVEQNGVFGF
jgi:hypothetical protein